MGKWAQGIFTPKNPKKYVGNHSPRYRSGWELRVMMFLDENQHITHWASEAISIPYRNPLTGKHSMYIPDFFVVYEIENKANYKSNYGSNSQCYPNGIIGFSLGIFNRHKMIVVHSLQLIQRKASFV